MVDTLQGSTISNLKELRPRSGRDVAIRVLFVFDPWSQAVLLVAGKRPATLAGGIRRRFRSPRPPSTGGWRRGGSGGTTRERVPRLGRPPGGAARRGRGRPCRGAGTDRSLDQCVPPC
ncbi:type II toxin-antitoxin system RelE/ParE family toxin [Actinoplanes sp. TBRC 11911]|uniref:type II toxin-antitoxin system RelE/ParE family toxin n=1 Tax=Actinoplanes sp. TBRC 11911 TaxID=2729386 RepID=UPI002007117E|nr:type II toxin-antitoxin system RelE/ParE family toxin [Actinoplanes sp. TBRC 11911]